MILFDQKLVKRGLPKNYINGELDFCSTEFSYKTNNVELLDFDNAIVSFTGLNYIDYYKICKKSLIHPSHINELRFGFSTIKKTLRSKFSKLNSNDKYLIAFDKWSNNHYHFITEVLPRLYIFRKEISEYILILPNTNYIKTSGVFFLELLKINPKNIIFINEHEIFLIPKIFLITAVSLSGQINDMLIDKIKTEIDLKFKEYAGFDNKIYISRRAANYRKVLNEDKVISLVKEHGFEVIEFESFSIKNQIEISAKSSTMISIHGAGLTNSIFMPRGSNIVEFRRNEIYHNQCYWHLADAIGHKYYYMFGIPDRNDVIEGVGCNLTIPIDPFNIILNKINNDTL